MKAIFSLVVILFLSVSFTTSNMDQPNSNTFDGIYNGLTEDMDFKFTDTKGKVHLFQEFEEEVSFDLYDEQYVGEKFKVTWEARDIEETDDEGEPTGEVSKVSVILELEKL